MDKKRVCIVGGGPGGLASLRRVLNSPLLTGTLFEQRDGIGGVWNYNGTKEFQISPKAIGKDGNGQVIHETVNAMYDELNCNVPYPLMELGDFSMKPTKISLPNQPEMHKYLKDYTNHFNLWHNIKLNTAVIKIRPDTPIESSLGHPGQWIVETHNQKDNVTTSEIFDSVIICIGKYTYPFEPPIPGIEKFKGEVIHSKYFRNAKEERFQGKDIVCIGLGPSSIDIGIYASQTAKSVTVSHRFDFGLKMGILPKNSREVARIKEVTKDGIITIDGEIISCDVIIYCTGYDTKFPFLDSSCGINITEEKYVHNMYNMTVYSKRPSLAILNLFYRVPEYYTNDIQARYFVSILEGKISLPSFPEMELSVKEFEDGNRGRPYSVWFATGEFIIAGLTAPFILTKLIEEMGLQDDYKHATLVYQTFQVMIFRIFGHAALYKKDVFRKIDDETWEYIFHHDEQYSGSKKGKAIMSTKSDSVKFIFID